MIQPQTNGATTWLGNLLITAGNARIQSALEHVLIMHAISTRSNGAIRAYGLLQITAQYVEAETLYVQQPARKMFVIQRLIKDALTANGTL